MTASVRLAGVADEAATDLGGQIAVQRELGWRGIELRTIDGRPLADLSASEREDVAAELAAAGLEVVALCSPIGNWQRDVTMPIEPELEELTVLAELGRRVGCRLVRVMSYPNAGLDEERWGQLARDRVGRLAAAAEERGLTLVLENCSGWGGASAERTLALIEAAASPALKVLFDVGNPVVDGYDGVDYLERVLPLVEHVHVKDARRDGGEVRFTAPGEGEAKLRRCLELLRAADYRGWLSIEPHVAHVFHQGRKAEDEELRRSYIEYGLELERLLATLGAGPAEAAR